MVKLAGGSCRTTPALTFWLVTLKVLVSWKYQIDRVQANYLKVPFSSRMRNCFPVSEKCPYLQWDVPWYGIYIHILYIQYYIFRFMFFAKSLRSCQDTYPLKVHQSQWELFLASAWGFYSYLRIIKPEQQRYSGSWHLIRNLKSHWNLQKSI